MPTPLGQRFSQVYLERGAPAVDSERFRRRLAEWYRSLPIRATINTPFAILLGTEAGIEVPYAAGTRAPVQVFLASPMRDVLDAVTLLFQTLEANGYPEVAVGWFEFVRRAMREENVGYRLDDVCGVHYFVDEEFERGRAATLARLGHPSLVAARAAFEDAFRHLDSQPRDTKAALRSIFEAAEIVAKQICPEAQRLNGKIIDGVLRTKCLVAIGGDDTEQKALAKMFDSFGQWVDGMHFYRHGQPADEPVAPSEELAVLAISSGSAYIRLLASVLVRGT